MMLLKKHVKWYHISFLKNEPWTRMDCVFMVFSRRPDNFDKFQFCNKLKISKQQELIEEVNALRARSGLNIQRLHAVSRIEITAESICRN